MTFGKAIKKAMKKAKTLTVDQYVYSIGIRDENFQYPTDYIGVDIDGGLCNCSKSTPFEELFDRGTDNKWTVYKLKEKK